MRLTDQAQTNRWSSAAIAAVTLFAFLVRFYYVCTAIVDRPIRGDALQYVAYARNLVAHHVFSMQAHTANPLPDSFRDPGFPVFLAPILSIFRSDESFYAAVVITQSILAALTVGAYSLLARRFFGLAAAIAVGVALALWPHLIVLSGNVLSETLLGFLVAVAILLLSVALDRKSANWGGWAGMTFAAAALTNAVLVPLIPLLAAVAAWRDAPRRYLWIVVLLTALLPPLIWAGRNVSIPSEFGSSDRATVNFVQGSWPRYHDAWTSATLAADDQSIATMRAMEEEQRLMQNSILAGLRMIASRFSEQPLRYLQWYASKPIELWGWSIGIGSGDIYVFPTYNSPLSTNGPLKVTTDIAFLLNRIIMLLAVVGIVLIFLHSSETPAGLIVAALLAAYVTFVFTVLQADVRYSVPYRGIEWLLAYATIHRFTSWVLRIRKKAGEPAMASHE